MNDTIETNGRRYRKPRRPLIVVCYDGCDPVYLADAITRKQSPRIASMIDRGFYASALSAMPSFTNPNNVSIVCGAPPRIHGVSGNYWLDRQTGKEVMMMDATPLRAPTILAGLASIGVKVATVTAKDKLRKVLAAGLAGPGLPGIAFSAEKADTCGIDEHGIEAAEALGSADVPDQYSADLSLFVLDAGIRLLASQRAEVLYLSLSDYVQHAYAPGAPQSDAFIGAVDERLGRFIGMGATVGIVADHGMTEMSLADGTANIIFLGDILNSRFGPGRFKVICPITDPFVRHHGALGGFVRVHILDGSDPSEVRDHIAKLPGIQHALLRDEACSRFDLDYEREGDIAVLAEKGIALGIGRGDHKLDQLAGARLRSHGGLAERSVPFVLSEPLTAIYRDRARNQPLHNYDIFDFALNGTTAS